MAGGGWLLKMKDERSKNQRQYCEFLYAGFYHKSAAFWVMDLHACLSVKRQHIYYHTACFFVSEKAAV